MSDPAADPLVRLRDLSITLIEHDGEVPLIRGVSFDIGPGEIVGLVGESGSGKSLTSMAILGMIPRGARLGGDVRFAGREVRALDDAGRRHLRGSDIRVVFQDPWSALNPFMRVGDQLLESIRADRAVTDDAGQREAIRMLDRVGIPEPEARFRAFPHEMSGGMLQRVVIAMALLARPKLLICDEPTTALDVTTEAQILDLIEELNRDLGMAVVFTTHDLPVAAELCHRVLVMYAGRIVEVAETGTIFGAARHPYTQALMAASPDAAPPGERLAVIEGTPPNPRAPIAGCRFHPRCRLVEPSCKTAEPALLPAGGEAGHLAACPVTVAREQAA